MPACTSMRSLICHHHRHQPSSHRLRILCSCFSPDSTFRPIRHQHRLLLQQASGSSSSRFFHPDHPLVRLRSSTSASNASSPARRPIRSTDGPTTSKSSKQSSIGKTKTHSPQKAKFVPVFRVPVILEDSLKLTPEIEELLQQLENDGPLAVKLAIEGKADLVPSETTELSLLICDDPYIQNLNNEWRGENKPTDVLSFPQDQPPGLSSLFLLGDVIISLDTAKRQAQERGHSVVDELRILLVHGLLHVLGYDHEEDPIAAAEMEKEEVRILQTLGWNSKGLINASNEVSELAPFHEVYKVKSKAPMKRKPLFKVLLCDMDGTLMNSQSKITEKTASALKEVIDRGVKVIVATGKTRPGVMKACRPAGLVGEAGIVSETSAGVFVQGLLVYGNDGKVVNCQHLDSNVCIKAFQYCLERKQPLLAFCGDQIVTLFEHPLTERLHTTYLEPKPVVVPSIDDFLKTYKAQKILIADTPEQITNVIRPYWAREVENVAGLVQAQAEYLEIVPAGSSKGNGVSLLLDHLGVHSDDVMAIGDGENDIEMLQLVGWGVAMGNAAAQTVAIADAQVASNDEDGVVEALERFLLT